MGTDTEKALKLARKTGVLRSRAAGDAGIPRVVLSRLVSSGKLQRVGRGLYTVTGSSNVSENHTLLEVSQRVGHGVICLLSALRFHRLTTQNPHEVWIAIDVKARLPKVESSPCRFVRFSGLALTTAVEHHTVEGVSVAIYSSPKTVADCFKYRNKLGLDIAVEALREYLRSRKRNLDELWQCAKACRVEKVMRPYIEALT